MAGSRGDDDGWRAAAQQPGGVPQPAGAQQPEVEVEIDAGAGSSGPSSPPSRVGRRIGVAVGVAAVFVFGVIVGRTGLGPGGTGGLSHPSTTAAAPTEHPMTTATGSHSRSSSPTRTLDRSASGTSAPTPADDMLNPAFTAAVQAFFAGRADIGSATIVGDAVVVLAPGRLARITYHGHGGLAPDGETAVGLPIGDPTYAAWQLISDGDSLWSISLGGANRVYRIDPSTVTPTHEWNAPVPAGSVVGAAALDGHLYLNTDSGVFDVAPDKDRITRSDVVARGGQAMAADPRRHRLLVLNDDGGWAVHAYRPPSVHPAGSGSLPFEARSIAVADGAIWVTGIPEGGGGGAVLARLDPTTLEVAGHGEVDTALVPTVVAAGRSLWLRDAGGGGQLWCVDARGGAVAQHWAELPGLVAARGGAAFVIEAGVVGRLDLTGACAG